jgi:secondary thiamine-phosphate synthase enzyme
MKTIVVETITGDEVIDITDEVEGLLTEGSGVCTIFVAHTTCALTTADLDPGTDVDFLNFLRSLDPHLEYQHPHDPKHAPDHLLASLIGPSVAIPFKKKRLQLGTWQRVVLVELSGPRTRTVHVSFLQEE